LPPFLVIPTKAPPGYADSSPSPSKRGGRAATPQQSPLDPACTGQACGTRPHRAWRRGWPPPTGRLSLQLDFARPTGFSASRISSLDVPNAEAK